MLLLGRSSSFVGHLENYNNFKLGDVEIPTLKTKFEIRTRVGFFNDVLVLILAYGLTGAHRILCVN